MATVLQGLKRGLSLSERRGALRICHDRTVNMRITPGLNMSNWFSFQWSPQCRTQNSCSTCRSLPIANSPGRKPLPVGPARTAWGGSVYTFCYRVTGRAWSEQHPVLGASGWTGAGLWVFAERMLVLSRPSPGLVTRDE